MLIVIYSRYVDSATGQETALVSRSRAHMVADARNARQREPLVHGGVVEFIHAALKLAGGGERRADPSDAGKRRHFAQIVAASPLTATSARQSRRTDLAVHAPGR